MQYLLTEEEYAEFQVSKVPSTQEMSAVEFLKLCETQNSYDPSRLYGEATLNVRVIISALPQEIRDYVTKM